MLPAHKKILRSTQGQILIFVTLAFVVLCLLVGLAADGGRAYLLKARLSKIVDAAAIAGARAMAAATEAEDPVVVAIAAACDSARINGFAVDGEDPGTCLPLTVAVEDVTTPSGAVQPGVIVSASQTMNTTFMRVGTLIGCGTPCLGITVAASGTAVPDTLVDVVLVMDDSGTQNDGCTEAEQNGGIGIPDPDGSCPIAQSRNGAAALVDCLLGDACGLTASNAKIGLVPFRGCYNADGAGHCVDDSGGGSLVVNLTDNNGALTSGINNLQAEGASGTNICLAIDRGRSVLFGSGSRPIARRVMIVLTDGDNQPRTEVTSPASCAISPPNNDVNINTLDTLTNTKADSLKTVNNVEIFVLRYASPSGDALTPGTCSPASVGTGSGRDNPNDNGDRNLSRCLASSAPGTNNHYFYAAAPTDIPANFAVISAELLKRLRLVR